MSVSSSKNSLWNYLWLKSETLLIVFIFFNIGVSALTGYFTPRLTAEFYQSLQDEASFKRFVTLLAILFSVEYLNRFLYQLSTHRYIQVLLSDIRKKSFSIWLKAPFKRNVDKKQDEYPLGSSCPSYE
jgi:ABC-type multidrug transport system fused ATPase/permease subunit